MIRRTDTWADVRSLSAEVLHKQVELRQSEMADLDANIARFSADGKTEDLIVNLKTLRTVKAKTLVKRLARYRDEIQDELEVLERESRRRRSAAERN